MNWLNWLKGGGPEAKKLQALLVVIVAAAVVVILTGNWGGGSPAAPAGQAKPADGNELEQLEAAMENKIAATLQKMDGVGQVTVAVTLASGTRSEFGVNQTHANTVQEEIPQQGQKRTQTQTNDNVQMVLAGTPNSGGSQPVKIVEHSPQISGVLVVAEGAKDPYVMEHILKSVQTLLGIPAGKVRVEPMYKGGQ